jgi:hypothetical protein
MGETGFTNRHTSFIPFFYFASAARLAEIPFLLIALWYWNTHSSVHTPSYSGSSHRFQSVQEEQRPVPRAGEKNLFVN